jgi:hypothetical protein
MPGKNYKNGSKQGLLNFEFALLLTKVLLVSPTTPVGPGAHLLQEP